MGVWVVSGSYLDIAGSGPLQVHAALVQSFTTLTSPHSVLPSVWHPQTRHPQAVPHTVALHRTTKTDQQRTQVLETYPQGQAAVDQRQGTRWHPWDSWTSLPGCYACGSWCWKGLPTQCLRARATTSHRYFRRCLICCARPLSCQVCIGQCFLVHLTILSFSIFGHHCTWQCCKRNLFCWVNLYLQPCWALKYFPMARMLCESVLCGAACHATCGSFGAVARHLSRHLLNISKLQLVMLYI